MFLFCDEHAECCIRSHLNCGEGENNKIEGVRGREIERERIKNERERERERERDSPVLSFRSFLLYHLFDKTAKDKRAAVARCSF